MRTGAARAGGRPLPLLLLLILTAAGAAAQGRLATKRLSPLVDIDTITGGGRPFDDSAVASPSKAAVSTRTAKSAVSVSPSKADALGSRLADLRKQTATPIGEGVPRTIATVPGVPVCPCVPNCRASTFEGAADAAAFSTTTAGSGRVCQLPEPRFGRRTPSSRRIRLLFNRHELTTISRRGVTCCNPNNKAHVLGPGDLDRSNNGNAVDLTSIELPGGGSAVASQGVAIADARFDVAVPAGVQRPVFSESKISGGRRGEQAKLARSRLPDGAKVFLRRMALDSGDNVARRAAAAPRRRSRLFATFITDGVRRTLAAAKKSASSTGTSAAARPPTVRFLRGVGVALRQPASAQTLSSTSEKLARNLRGSPESQLKALQALQLLQQVAVSPAGSTATRTPRPRLSDALRRVTRRKRSAMPPPPRPIDTCKKRLPGRCIKREKKSRCLRRRYGVCIRHGSSEGRCIEELPGECIDATIENCQKEPKVKCTGMNDFRFMNGQCNNLREPRWGRALTGLRRVMDNTYEDGVFAPRSVSAAGGLLPGARAVSMAVFRDAGAQHHQRTMSVVTFGQFVDHDLSVSPEFQGVECCRHNDVGPKPVREQHPQCLPIDVPASDPFYRAKGRRCMSFVRSIPSLDPDCMAKPATQQNELTSWADLSQVYGSSDDQLLPPESQLRSKIGGALRTHEAGNFLPQVAPGIFLAGDGRVSENMLLALFHTVFLREHNRVAASLAARHSWGDELLFQEARRIVIGQYQHILFNEWLPALLGDQFCRDVGLSGDFGSDTYADFLNPSISTEFSTAAFRLHSMVQGVIELANRVGTIRKRIPLQGHFFNSQELIVSQQLVEMARGVTRTNAMQFDGSFVRALRGDLFVDPTKKPGGLDLTALNIQRGRDHGIPTYATVASRCNNIRIRSWSDLRLTIRSGDLRRLRRTYKHWRDVDLFVGMNLEKLAPGAMVGPTARCVLADQFLRTRYADRLYYDHGGQRGHFSKRQVQQIRRASWARLLCDNVGRGFTSVQPQAFLAPSSANRVVSCNSNRIKKVDLTQF